MELLARSLFLHMVLDGLTVSDMSTGRGNLLSRTQNLAGMP